MKIVLFGATGNIGRRIAQEAARRGHHVLGVSRQPSAAEPPDAHVRLTQGDATDAASVADAARGADAVVSAISPRPSSRGLPQPRLVDNVRALIEGLGKARVERVLYVGGAGSLEVAPGRPLVEQPDFPAAYKDEALEGRDALTTWRREGDGLAWTYLSPAAEIGPGERTGSYRTTADRLLADGQGRSYISYEDYAVAVLDELEQPRHVRERFGVAY